MCDYSNIVKVEQVTGADVINEYLQDGWILITAKYFTEHIPKAVIPDSITLYALMGLPKEAQKVEFDLGEMEHLCK